MSYNLGDIAERLRRSTVQIRAGRGRSGGSGVIWSSTGLIVTNRHVVESGAIEVELWDGRRFPAKLKAWGRHHDLAAIKVDTLGLPAAAFGSSAAVRPGEIAIAVGNPLGFAGAVSRGVVHAVGPLRGAGPQTWIQAAVRLAPGNSGGPLANASGKVIGLNTMVLGNGLALAIPSGTVMEFLRVCEARRGAA